MQPGAESSPADAARRDARGGDAQHPPTGHPAAGNPFDGNATAGDPSTGHPAAGNPAGGAWAVLAIRPYRTLFISATIVIFGVMGQAVARGWLARDLTGNNAGLGGAMLAFGASMLVTTPLGGVAADRYPKRRVLLASVAALTVSSVGIGVAVVADAIEYWMLVAASAIQAAAFAFYLPARISLISELVDAATLKNAVVLAQTAQESARVFAPALAGVLLGVSWFGVGGVFLSAAAFSLVAGGLLLSLPKTPARAPTGVSPLGEMVDAVQYLRRNPDVGAIAVLTVAVVMVGFPYLTFLPTLADERFDVGALGYGVMSGAAGLGAALAGTFDTLRNRGLRPRRTIVLSAVGFGGAVGLLGLAPSYPLALVAVVAVGGGGLLFQTSTQALMLRLSPLEYHGRLQSMVILGFSGFGLAALPLGVLADAFSLGAVFVGMGTVVIACAGAFTLQWRASVRARGPEVA